MNKFPFAILTVAIHTLRPHRRQSYATCQNLMGLEPAPGLSFISLLREEANDKKNEECEHGDMLCISHMTEALPLSLPLWLTASPLLFESELPLHNQRREMPLSFVLGQSDLFVAAPTM